MGLVRDHSEAHYETMTYEELETRLKEIKELPDGETTREELTDSLKHWERTRHLMIWSEVNHGHILLTLNAVYDPAFYYTSQELGGKDVQEMVEKPQIYLMARCRDTIEDQLLYSDTRLEDIQQLIQGSPLPTLSSSLKSVRCFMATIHHGQLRVGSNWVETMAAVVALCPQHSILTT